MNVILGIARFGFLALLVLFMLYLTWLLRKDVE